MLTRRLGQYYKGREYTRRLGYDPGPDEGWPRIGYAKGQTEVRAICHAQVVWEWPKARVINNHLPIIETAALT